LPVVFIASSHCLYLLIICHKGVLFDVVDHWDDFIPHCVVDQTWFPELFFNSEYSFSVKTSSNILSHHGCCVFVLEIHDISSRFACRSGVSYVLIVLYEGHLA